ncbi:hypothetical protein GUITHDRAFT_135429 [Guillardia theta CCMP2712]|uniref:PDZ domain-containing protein n=1 Tax=Guillardia theta (strain CCMP2712) TaxID=905079 RepID=L1JPA6_GUITC|nr:hypothetical protein GUITHDRAFT_135429 [Guillardia theta CCMP2712]EKX50267.1 hypothetical protein GUITHDRAFT_135429 [Guillardia theta CCMP2712]|eukprot:XP_005837247.1 hypothetical protein GUITHDRAFT_135429 [Guillardia theta CCMP2712]
MWDRGSISNGYSWYVTVRLVPGGPAWESSSSGGLQVGDVLQTVDGKNVYRWPVAQLAPLLLGPESSTVRLGVQVGIGAEEAKEVDILAPKSPRLTSSRFNPPPEPYSSSRPPIVDARRGLGSKDALRSAGMNGSTKMGEFTAA